MGLIKNYELLNTSRQKKIVLDLIEAALASIQPENIFKKNFNLVGQKLKILDQEIDLSNYNQIFLLGFGKGSAGNCKIIENELGNKISHGFVIDVADPPNFSKIEYTKGTHPVCSQTNVDFTTKAVEVLSKLGEKTLVLTITCGGGSALLELPTVPLETLIAVDEALLKSSANIHDMNVIRKHLSKVKGGGLAEIIYPAHVVNLIFSDVPGNDLSVIASGPFVADSTSQDEAWVIYKKYDIDKKVQIKKNDFTQTISDQKVFENINNILFLSNLTALNAMKSVAEEKGLQATIYSDHFQAEAKKAGKELVEKTASNTILLAGGETTVEVAGAGGKGGRNQELVLSIFPTLDENTVIASFDSDGWDNTEFAGAIGDRTLIKKAADLNLDPQVFLNGNDSFNFFKAAESGLETGRLPSNVSDLMIVYKK